MLVPEQKKAALEESELPSNRARARRANFYPRGVYPRPLSFDHPSIAITRAYQRARNNRDFDSQSIDRSSNAGGMDSLDTCNSSFQLNHVRRFQLCGIAYISDCRADLQGQCELGDVDVAIDITLPLANVIGKVIVFLHLNGSTT